MSAYDSGSGGAGPAHASQRASSRIYLHRPSVSAGFPALGVAGAEAPVGLVHSRVDGNAEWAFVGDRVALCYMGCYGSHPRSVLEYLLASRFSASCLAHAVMLVSGLALRPKYRMPAADARVKYQGASQSSHLRRWPGGGGVSLKRRVHVPLPLHPVGEISPRGTVRHPFAARAEPRAPRAPRSSRQL